MDTDTFSIIVPAYGRPNGLVNCLEALCRLDFPHGHYEVIVVDDGSPVALEPICARYKERLNMVFAAQSNKGPAAARNRGSELAGGKYLAFTDDDCMPTSDWLKAMNRHLDANPSRAVAGRMVNTLRGNPYAAASQVLIEYLYQYYNKNSARARFLTSSSLGVSTVDFRETGGFDESFPRPGAEDRDFCARWIHSGREVLFDPGVVVLHAHELSLAGYFKQHFHYGRGAFHYKRKCLARGQRAFRVDPFVFYKNLIFHVINRGRAKPKIQLSMLLLLSQFVNAFGFAWEKFNIR